MSGKKMWFGTLYSTSIPGTSSTTVNAKMQWVPAPDTGMAVSDTGWSELIEFENGGADVVSTSASHRVYDMDWNVRVATGDGGLDRISDYKKGIYGPGLIYFADPMAFQTNLFPPHWATPSLSGMGWPAIATPASYPNVPSNIYNLPPRAFTSVTGPVDKPSGDPARIVTIPIPPGYTLWTCFRNTPGTGAAGSIGTQPINLDGSYAAVNVITGNVPGSAPVTAYSGVQYKAVEFWVAGAVSNLASCMAQLLPDNMPAPPLSTAQHIPGQGNTGCKFTGSAQPQTYVMASQQYKGMSTTLTEVGAWQKVGT